MIDMNNLLLTPDGGVYIIKPSNDKFTYEEMCEYLGSSGIEYVYFDKEDKVAVISDDDFEYQENYMYNTAPMLNLMATEVTKLELLGRVLILNENELE